MAHYNRAPIAEAVIDLQLGFEEQPTVTHLAKYAASLRDSFPQSQRINTFALAFAASNAGEISSNTASETLGVRLTSSKGDRILQLRRQGLSYSHMQPYSEWESFAEEMRPILENFVLEFKATSVNRLAVRYINRIVVPQGVELDTYLNLSPRLIGDVSADLQGYFMQLVLPQKDLGVEYTAIVNSGLEAAPDPKAMAVLLDIDVFCTKQLAMDSAAVWDVLYQLRERKNKIFEAAITDEVRRMIE
ncbi:TIGR04255 family protein [Variovorax sp. VaC1]|uniref:TIGR04255 family protein n=1 Tax=Variovorax sp. VaC1 TaxID=3373132 RepID=UPI00374A3957